MVTSEQDEFSAERFAAICAAREIGASFNQLADELERKGATVAPAIADQLQETVIEYCVALRAFTG